jgi:DNA (cytosine-5)-methyltransferase 1
VTLTVGSLFSGIGGIDLGLERAGMTVKWHSEINPYASRVLKKHWPTIPNLGNIKDIDWSTVEPVDIIAGGYPCQPFSIAGNRQGDKDERHLWPYFLRAISELRPRYAFLENVRGHLSMGFDRVLGDLAEIGYDAEWQVVSAASVGAPHRRDRIICVAYPQSDWQRRGYSKNTETISERVAVQTTLRGSGCVVSDDECIGYGEYGIATDIATTSRIWRNDRNRTEGYVGWEWWSVEPDVGRVAHGVPSRVDRLRGLGNAVVPQVAEYVGRLIMEAHNERSV